MQLNRKCTESEQMASLRERSIKAVLFDLDGTLVDTVGDFEVALNHMLRTLALPSISASEIRHIIGKGSEHLIRTVLACKLQQAGLPHGPESVAEKFQAAWDLYLNQYMDINGEHAAVYDGVLSGLQALRSHGLPLAVVTNKPLALAVPLLKSKGLDGWVEFLYGGDSFSRKKPDPLPMLKACERLQLDPQHVLMVGDSSNDAQAARAAGCAVVLLPYGYNHGEPIEAVDSDGCFDSIADIARELLAS